MYYNNRNAVVLLLMICGLCACRPDGERLLQGSWTAFAILEGADTLAVDPAQVGFTFAEDGRYRYRSTLNYQEAGPYRLEGNFLLTTDTTRPGGAEKMVEILQLDADTLRIKMMEGDLERWVTLLREE